MTSATTAVIVEDDAMNAEYFRILCTDFGLKVVGMAANADDAFNLISANRPDYIIMDVRIEGEKDGIDLAYDVHQVMPEVKIVYVTGSAEGPTMDRIRANYPHRVLIKPIDREQLFEAVS